MPLQQLRKYVRVVEQATEEIDKTLKEGGGESGGIMQLPPVILLLPGMLVSGRMVSSRIYNQQERNELEEAQRDSPEHPETGISIEEGLMRLFPEPTPEEAEAILEEDYEPQTIYLLDVAVIVGAHGTELPGIAVEFDRVLGWKRGQLSA